MAGFPDARIKEILTDRYGEVMAKRVWGNFAVPERVFERGVWPSCFDCHICDIESFCRYLPLLRRVKTMQRMQQTNMPRQAELAKVFDNTSKGTW